MTDYGGVCGVVSSNTLQDESTWGEASAMASSLPSSFGDQAESTKNSSSKFSFSRVQLGNEVGGRAAMFRMKIGSGTISAGALNDDDHIFTRTHCYSAMPDPAGRETRSDIRNPSTVSFNTERYGTKAQPGRRLYDFERPASSSLSAKGASPGPGAYDAQTKAVTKRPAGVFMPSESADGGTGNLGRATCIQFPIGYGTGRFKEKDGNVRPHTHDMRGYSTTLGSKSSKAFGSATDFTTKNKSLPAFGFGSTTREINPRMWQRRGRL